MGMTIAAMGIRLSPCAWNKDHKIKDSALCTALVCGVVDLLGVITAVVLGILAAIGVIQISALACFVSVGVVLALDAITVISVGNTDLNLSLIAICSGGFTY